MDVAVLATMKLLLTGNKVKIDNCRERHSLSRRLFNVNVV